MDQMMDLVVWIFSIIAACAAKVHQRDLDYIGDNLDIQITVHNDIKENNEAKHRFSLIMTNTGSKTIRRDGWEIYFYSFFMVEPGNLPSTNGYILPKYKVKFSHINGCLFSMAPTSDFPDIAPNGSHFVEFHAQWWAVSRTDVPPNWYVTAPTLKPVNIKSTATGKRFVTDFKTVDQWKRYLVDQYNPFTAQDRYRRYEFRDFNTHTKLVIPTPKNIEVQYQRFLNIKDKTVVCTQDAHQSCLLLKGENIGLYHLFTDVDDGTVTLIGRSPIAVYYGIQSLLSLVSGSLRKDSVPDVSIKDEPRFEHRGMHVDVSRNFRTKADIIRLMEAMSMYKMNKLHLHLTDDEGWRLEIPGIPELTEIGGKRCHDLEEKSCVISQLGSGGDTTTSGSGYYTVADFQEILTEATKRFIEVIPEIDMPGHSHAAIVAMEARYHKYKTTNPTLATQYRLIDPTDTSEYESVQMFNDNAINPCIESTYAFVGKVVSEIKKMYDGYQQFKVFHFGGDEVETKAWVNSTECRQFTIENPLYNTTRRLKEYFVLRLANITHSLRANFAGWEDGLLKENGLPFDRTLLPNSAVYANAWQNIWEWGVGRRAYDLANSGYKVILSHATHLFFDQPQEPDPEEAGLYWATRFTDAKKTFHFLSDRLYDNIEVSRSGERLTKADVCGDNMENCPSLELKENIIGLQGQSWGETFMTPGVFDSMVFPRLLALAERAWHKASLEEKDFPASVETAYRDWESFANTVGHKELPRLRQLGIHYRIAPPGAIVKNGYLKVNNEFPGHVVQYSQDNGNIWLDFPHEWFLLGRHPMLMRSCTGNKLRCSREVTFSPEEPAPISDQNLVDYIANNSQPAYEVLRNHVHDDTSFIARISLTSTGTKDLFYGNWEIYFNFIRLPDYSYLKEFVFTDCNMTLYYVSGSLFKLKPRRYFHLNKARSVSCTLKAKNLQGATTEPIPNWYVTAEAMRPKTIQTSEDKQRKTKGKKYRKP